jgi:glycosyltransferase involved in cell wall biosynthesis
MINTQLTVIIPVFNEINSIEQLLIKVLNSKIDKQIIVVDDYSSDGTRELLINKFKDKMDKIIFHQKNLGKGAAIKSAQKYIIGKYTIIQDADLEYDPADYPILINEAIKNKFKVVYGSRVLNKNMYTNTKNFSHKIRIWGNIFLTFLSNKINNQKLTDAHTCYKLFDSDLFKSINLQENDFSFCPEITTKLSNKNIIIKEVPINYKGRTYDEGKKIKSSDGLKAIFVLFKYKFFY